MNERTENENRTENRGQENAKIREQKSRVQCAEERQSVEQSAEC
jgi:hypothetical protein